MKIDKCPFCGSEGCLKQYYDETRFIGISCNEMKRTAFISYDTIYKQKDLELKNRILNLISEYVLHYYFYLTDKKDKRNCFFYYDPDNVLDYSEIPYCINVYDIMPTYPKLFTDKIDRILLNLSKLYPDYGEIIIPEDTFARYLFCDEFDLVKIYGSLTMLKEAGLLAIGKEFYHISAEGWKRIDVLQNKQRETRQGFIAMAFRDETKSIREAFRSAIIDSGFAARVIDEKEHNNQIVPEIFFEIERSKFVVVDVTYPNYGAYYEAGYAQALGKQVIICCREEEFKNNDTRPHFDISQRSMIVWKDEEDLVARLKRRIEATVK